MRVQWRYRVEDEIRNLVRNQPPEVAFTRSKPAAGG
jgi:hypothetical protein